jgi:hypothetical protein
MSLFQNTKDLPHLSLRHPMILRQFDARLKPHLDFTLRRFDMHVHSILFPRVEVKPMRSITEDGGTHDKIVTFKASASMKRGFGLCLVPRLDK